MDKTVSVSGIGEYKNPISQLVQTACKYDSHISLESGTKSINAKSLLGVLSLGIMGGTDIRIIADGSDEEEAVEGLVALVKSGFND